MNCREPDCGGEIGADGFCQECGLKSRAGTNGSAPTSPRVATGAAAVSKRSSSRTTKVARPRLGAGLVEIAPVPQPGPAGRGPRPTRTSREERRLCSNPDCGQPVGRAKDGQPGRTEGFCPGCRHPVPLPARSWRPAISSPGSTTIEGCIAHGGLGWIYLARDRNVADKWVVLKGLLNRSDPDAVAAALAELRFLAEIDHPNIVRIINGVQHGDDALHRHGLRAGHQPAGDARPAPARANGGDPDRRCR